MPNVAQWTGSFKMTGTGSGRATDDFGDPVDFNIQETITGSPVWSPGTNRTTNASLLVSANYTAHNSDGSTTTASDTGDTFSPAGNTGTGFGI